nr:unnamed protein product [Spirometra erinaceieuropaei]
MQNELHSTRLLISNLSQRENAGWLTTFMELDKLFKVRLRSSDSIQKSQRSLGLALGLCIIRKSKSDVYYQDVCGGGGGGRGGGGGGGDNDDDDDDDDGGGDDDDDDDEIGDALEVNSRYSGVAAVYILAVKAAHGSLLSA